MSVISQYNWKEKILSLLINYVYPIGFSFFKKYLFFLRSTYNLNCSVENFLHKLISWLSIIILKRQKKNVLQSAKYHNVFSYPVFPQLCTSYVWTLQYKMYPIPCLNPHPFYSSLKDMIFYVTKTVMIGNLLVMIE